MPKPKGTKGGNPSPVQTPEFLARQFPPASDVPSGVELASKPLCVKLPIDVYALVEPMENRSEWLRRVICEAAARELMGGEVKPASDPKPKRARRGSKSLKSSPIDNVDV